MSDSGSVANLASAGKRATRGKPRQFLQVGEPAQRLPPQDRVRSPVTFNYHL
ncbi:MAG TPA: hypothetical protein IGS40_01320 [Trichormus sp. M33_DOE_039]|nr:hypothetical protein [Trichormus sp. M33_DOE_039]